MPGELTIDGLKYRQLAAGEKLQENGTYKTIGDQVFVQLVDTKSDAAAGTDKFEFSKTNYGVGKDKPTFEALILTKNSKELYKLTHDENGKTLDDIKETLTKYMRSKDSGLRKGATDVLKYIEKQEAIDGGNVKTNNKGETKYDRHGVAKLNGTGKKQVKNDMRSDKSLSEILTTEVIVSGDKKDLKAAKEANKDSGFMTDYKKLGENDRDAVKKLKDVFVDYDGDGKISSDEYKAGVRKLVEITNKAAVGFEVSDFPKDPEKLSKEDLKVVQQFTGKPGEKDKVFFTSNENGKLSAEEYQKGLPGFVDLLNKVAPEAASQSGQNKYKNFLDYAAQDAAGNKYDISEHRVRSLAGASNVPMQMSKLANVVRYAGAGVAVGASVGALAGSLISVGVGTSTISNVAGNAAAQGIVNGAATSAAGTALGAGTGIMGVSNTLAIAGASLGAGLGGAAGTYAGLQFPKGNPVEHKILHVPVPGDCPQQEEFSSDCDNPQFQQVKQVVETLKDNPTVLAAYIGSTSQLKQFIGKEQDLVQIVEACDQKPAACVLEPKYDRQETESPDCGYEVKYGDNWYNIVQAAYGIKDHKETMQIVHHLKDRYGVKYSTNTMLKPGDTMVLDKEIYGHKLIACGDEIETNKDYTPSKQKFTSVTNVIALRSGEVVERFGTHSSCDTDPNNINWDYKDKATRDAAIEAANK